MYTKLPIITDTHTYTRTVKRTSRLMETNSSDCYCKQASLLTKLCILTTSEANSMNSFRGWGEDEATKSASRSLEMRQSPRGLHHCSMHQTVPIGGKLERSATSLPKLQKLVMCVEVIVCNISVDFLRYSSTLAENGIIPVIVFSISQLIRIF